MGRRLTPTALIIATATALALLLRLYQLLRPGHLLSALQYDDGVYLGSAIRLADGVLPYRDFVFVQPPGIVVLMAPIGFLAKLTGTATAMAVARLLTVCVGVAAVPLAGWLVRHRGPIAVTLACGILAVHPDAVNANSSLFLEPWVVLFLLLGALAIFEGDRVTARGRRLVWGGVAIGFAGAIKTFAVFPALALLVLLAVRKQWRRAAAYLGGVIVGFVVPVAPFAAFAPARAFHDVIVAQLQRIDVRVPVANRLTTLFGLPYLHLSPRGADFAAGMIMAVVVACSVGATLLTRELPPRLELFVLLAGGLALVGLLVPTAYYPHYAALFAPFLALSLALTGARFGGALSARSALLGGHGALIAAVLAGGAILAFGAMAIKVWQQGRLMSAVTLPSYLQRDIRPGACVLSAEASVTILSDRFVSDVPGCSQMVDAIGTNLALGGGRNGLNGAGRYPADRAAWMSAFRQAQYVWLVCSPPGAPACDQSTNSRIPWTSGLRDYFTRHFHPLVPYHVYARNGLRASRTSLFGVA